MKRNTSLLLVVAAVAGVVATAALFMLYAGDAAPARAGARGTAADTGPDLRGPATVARAAGATTRAGAQKSRLRNGAVLPGSRPPPADSAETIQQRYRDSQRVLEILDEIMSSKPENSSKRYDLHRELKTLLRRLGHYVDPGVRARLLEMLHTANPRWHRLVGEALGCLKGDVETAKALIDMVRNGEASNVYTRNAVYTALGSMDVKEVIPDLMGMLGCARPDEHLVVAALGKLAGPKEAGILLDMLQGNLRPETRQAIQRVLVDKHGYPGLMDSVAKRLPDADATTRTSLVQVLAMTGEPKYGQTLRKLLDNETDHTVRDAAIRALGRIGDLDSGKRLLEMAQSGSPDDQRRAASAMRYIRDAETVGKLAEDWDRLNDDGRRAVMGAAAQVSKPGPDLNRLAITQGLFDKDMRVRTSAVKLLGRSGANDNVDAIAQYIGRSKHPSEWSAGFRSLITVNTKTAAERGLSYLDVVPDKRTRENYQRRFEKILKRSP